MFLRPILKPLRRCHPIGILYAGCGSHQPTCTAKTGAEMTGGVGGVKHMPKRGEPPKTRWGFAPDDWFLFFRPITGVSGPYILLFTFTNYVLSKEIYILEHEFYCGISILIMWVYASKNIFPDLAKFLDKELDDHLKNQESGRNQEIAAYEIAIKEENHAQASAQGQKLLIDAKKENVLMQLEAAYRERCFQVYQAVKGRLDYHSKKYYAEGRVHQKWMVQWILEQVNKSITPEFEKAVFEQCIQDLSLLAGRA